MSSRLGGSPRPRNPDERLGRRAPRSWSSAILSCPWSRAIFGSWAVALILLRPVVCSAGDRKSTWGGEVGIERFHTSDLFPGVSISRPDWGLRASLKASATVPITANLGIIGWAKLVAERYDFWTARNLERWTLGTDFRGNSYRIRIYGERTSDELYFPATASDGAILDRSAVGSDIRVEVLPGWRADLKVEYEFQNFVPTFDERDAHRWRFRSGFERSFGAGRSLSLSHEYRRAMSVTKLFSYEQNDLRGLADWSLPLGVAVELEAQLGIRNYRTGQAFAANFGRGDTRGLVGGKLGHTLAGPLRAELYGEWRRRSSTRISKSYDVSTIGITLSANRL